MPRPPKIITSQAARWYLPLHRLRNRHGDEICPNGLTSTSRIPSYARNFTHRLPQPALGRGRVQKAARREFYLNDVVDTAAVVRRAYCRKYFLDGRKPDAQDYRMARRALELIAVPIGRGGGRGRPLLWKLRERNMAAT